MDALLAQTRPPDRVVLVDNRSGDGSVEHIRDAYPSVDLIEAPMNGGYGTGMNLGMSRAAEWGADAILLLTHECVLAQNALAVMLRRIEENPAVGAAGPIVGFLSRPGKVFSAGGYINQRTWDVYHLGANRDLQELKDQLPRRVDWLDGCCVLLRREAAQQTGSIDEGYFLQYEEVEYQVRLQKYGWAVECVPAAVAWQEPSTGLDRLIVRNRLRFVFRNAPRKVAARELIRQLYYLFRELLPGGNGYRYEAKTHALGILDYVLRRGPRARSYARRDNQ